MAEIQLAGNARTPFGSFGGAFADVSAVELGKGGSEQFENPSKEDIDGVLLTIRYVERRLLDRFENT